MAFEGRNFEMQGTFEASTLCVESGVGLMLDQRAMSPTWTNK
jgi:hypothetical protein